MQFEALPAVALLVRVQGPPSAQPAELANVGGDAAPDGGSTRGGSGDGGGGTGGGRVGGGDESRISAKRVSDSATDTRISPSPAQCTPCTAVPPPGGGANDDAATYAHATPRVALIAAASVCPRYAASWSTLARPPAGTAVQAPSVLEHGAHEAQACGETPTWLAPLPNAALGTRIPSSVVLAATSSTLASIVATPGFAAGASEALHSDSCSPGDACHGATASDAVALAETAPCVAATVSAYTGPLSAAEKDENASAARRSVRTRPPGREHTAAAPADGTEDSSVSYAL